MMWENFGVFNYLLPFLLMFAIVFGILQYLKIFGDNRMVHVVIAFVVGLLAIRWTQGGMLNRFYEELFPRLGIGVTVLLLIIILVGLFIPEEEVGYWMYGLGAIGVAIAVVVLVQTFGILGWSYGVINGDIVAWVILGILIIGLVIAVAVSSGKRNSSEHEKKPGNRKLRGIWSD